MPPQSTTAHAPPVPPLKQKMALGFKSFFDGARKLALGDAGDAEGKASATDDLFPRTTPEVDGDECVHDCASCTVKYPRHFKIEESDVLYGHVKGWSTHVLVATSKTDWVRDVEDEKGSVMQAIGKAEKPENGKLMLSASNIPTPSHTSDYSEPTTVLLLPAFAVIENVTPASVPALIAEYVSRGPTNTSPLARFSLPRSIPGSALAARPSPHRALVLLCSQKTRDARCGQSAPLIRKELERHLRPLGLYRDLDDHRPGGVGIYFISHVGGHKYSANVIIYRRPDAFGLDAVARGQLPEAERNNVPPAVKIGASATASATGEGGKGGEGDGDGDGDGDDDPGAAQCIWLARVKPEDCENIVKYTVLQGKVVKPDHQLRGGFDRAKGLMSW